MKLVIQIPCYNEAETLPLVFADLPKSIPGVTSIETVVIDDGSTDSTAEIARKLGATHIFRHTHNLGLAFSFRKGMDICLENGADIIVNMDGDNQYKGGEIAKLIEPILSRHADVVIGNRQTHTIAEFSFTKKLMQKLGTFVVRRLSKIAVHDAVSGFRAFSREAALKTTILSNHTYTLESILQARAKGLRIVDIPISTNPKTRESRLIKSLKSYIAFSTATIIRVFTMYNPLRVFLYAGTLFLVSGFLLSARFLYFYLYADGSGKIQSLILAAVCLIIGVVTILFGLIADLIQFNRRLLEDILLRIRTLEGKKPGNTSK